MTTISPPPSPEVSYPVHKAGSPSPLNAVLSSYQFSFTNPGDAEISILGAFKVLGREKTIGRPTCSNILVIEDTRDLAKFRWDTCDTHEYLRQDDIGVKVILTTSGADDLHMRAIRIPLERRAVRPMLNPDKIFSRGRRQGDCEVDLKINQHQQLTPSFPTFLETNKCSNLPRRAYQ
jgi:hypothetical protein